MAKIPDELYSLLSNIPLPYEWQNIVRRRRNSRMETLFGFLSDASMLALAHGLDFEPSEHNLCAFWFNAECGSILVGYIQRPSLKYVQVIECTAAVRDRRVVHLSSNADVSTCATGGGAAVLATS